MARAGRGSAPAAPGGALGKRTRGLARIGCEAAAGARRKVPALALETDPAGVQRAGTSGTPCRLVPSAAGREAGIGGVPGGASHLTLPRARSTPAPPFALVDKATGTSPSSQNVKPQNLREGQQEGAPAYAAQPLATPKGALPEDSCRALGALPA